MNGARTSNPLGIAGSLVTIVVAIVSPIVIMARWSATIDAQMKTLTASVTRVVENADERNDRFDEMSAALNEAKKAAQEARATGKDTNATGQKVRVEVGSLEWRLRMLEEAHRQACERH